MQYFIFILLLSSSFACNEHKASEKDGIRVVRSGLDIPWEITWSKDDHIWMTERNGRVSRIDPFSGKTTFSFTIAEVEGHGEGGLLGLALDPSFEKNGFLYVVYNYSKNGIYQEKLVRYTYNGNTLIAPNVLLDGIKAAGIHNGSRIWIGQEKDPKLFLSTGDAADQTLPQQKNNLNGKILRLNLDGTIPSDNPFPGNPIWSFGHRNIQGMVAARNILYAAEHGPSVEDEVNIITRGANYGWPEITGPCDKDQSPICRENNFIDPLWSSGGNTLAVCGLDYYNRDLIPAWKNSLLIMTLKNSSIRQLVLSEDGRKIVRQKKWFDGEWGRLRDICISPTGKVYICTSNGNNRDMIIEISKL